MPAMWPTFIPNLAGDIAGQSFTKPGGAMVSYELPKVGVDQVPIFPPSADLIKSIKPGNPLNAALTTDPTAMINAINLAPLSGRYDFGVRVAERYLEAVKGLAMTPFGATHTNNPAAEFLLKQGYGLVFERILKEGDIPLQDQKDKDGNIIEMGKESHPDYADFCPDPVETPDPVEEQKKLDKKFNKFVDDYKSDSSMDLKKFRFFEFPCLSGNETQAELENLFAARLIEQYKTSNDKAEFKLWAECLGSKKYKDSTLIISDKPYPNISTSTRADISSAGYNWQSLADNVSDLFIAGIEGNGPTLDCPLNEWKIQVAYDFDHNPPENPSKRPKILTSNVVATFSWYPGLRQGSFAYINGSTVTAPKWIKTPNWIENVYEENEWENHWRKIPNAMSNARTPKAVTDILPTAGGTVWKFQRQQVVDAISAAEECDAAEADSDINYSWPGGDPYEEMAEITIAYWYACIVKPFAPTPSALPALIPAPLTGIYIPIYYGGKKRLAGNLRKAWNTGKTFSVIPAPQPPALAVSTAVAAAYALHLLEFKLLYLGGIPTPVGPVPMVGIVPVVF
tara:strand:+ start:9741 stop:11441 length:1701 start_codon:yes stop_codon:yes gene_type:complete